MAAVRHGFEASVAEGPTSAPDARCDDAATPSVRGSRLGAALYACFDSLGNQIEFDGGRITRVASLQLLQELDDPARRKALFYALSPLWRAINGTNELESPYRRLVRDAAKDFEQRESPIHAAAAALGVEAEEAERWLVAVLDAWHRANATDRDPIEPWDYRYRYAAASRQLSSVIPKAALLPLQQHFYRDLGADPTRLGILFDLDPRPGKAPLAYSDVIRIGRMVNGVWRPAISRVSANDDRGGLGVLNELVHETGHAVHFLAIRARPAFFWPDDTFIEAFADVPSWSVYSPEWQRRYLGIAASRGDSLREQYAGVMLDVAWSLFEIRMLRDPAADPNLVWTEITQTYLNIAPHPEIAWWAARSQLVTDPGYMLNYGLGAVITAEIRAKTRQAIGPFDSGNHAWYGWTSAHLLRDGGRIDTPVLLRRFLGHQVSPAPLVGDITSLAAKISK